MSLRAPVCDYCKHYIDNPDLKRMCCEAFPEGIPLERMRLEDDGTECSNGIRFECQSGEYQDSISRSEGLLNRMHRI